MTESNHIPDRPGDLPPPYSPTDYSHQHAQGQTLIVGANSNVFHKGARFNEFAKPTIPPPPPGCPPNQYQRMQMETGQIKVVVNDPREPKLQNKYGTF